MTQTVSSAIAPALPSSRTGTHATGTHATGTHTTGTARRLPHAPGAAGEAARLTKAAQDFTAVALGEMLKPMFDTLDASGGMFGGGPGEQAWRPMMVDEIAKAMARQGGLGLSGPVTQAMLQMQEKAK